MEYEWFSSQIKHVKPLSGIIDVGSLLREGLSLHALVVVKQFAEDVVFCVQRDNHIRFLMVCSNPVLWSFQDMAIG